MWNLVVTRACVHGTDDTPAEDVERAAEQLHTALHAAVASVQALNPGVVVDMTGTVRTEDDVRAALGLPPARTAEQRHRDERAAREAAHQMALGQMTNAVTAAQAERDEALAELEKVRGHRDYLAGRLDKRNKEAKGRKEHGKKLRAEVERLRTELAEATDPEGN